MKIKKDERDEESIDGCVCGWRRAGFDNRATDKQSEFLLTFLMELATLGCAFLALRLFKFEKIHQELTTGKAAALRSWGMIRLLMLLVPLWADTLLYYLYMNTTFGYLGIILALCLPFVYPSMNRCETETEA